MTTLLVAACTPSVQPVQVAVESQAKLTKTYFITEDGAVLPLRSWLPKGKPKAVILALHGFNDYSHAFDMPGKYLSANGVAVYAYDQRGFGDAPMTGIWAGTQNLTRDLKQGVALLKKRYAHTPVYIMGESMGGAVAIVALSEPDFPKVKGLILVAPAVWGDSALNPLMRLSLWVMAHTVPGHRLTGEDLEILASDNLPMLNAMWHDERVLKGSRVDAVYGLVRLMGEAYTQAALVQTPSLMLHGDRDEVIPRWPIVSVVDGYTASITTRYYANGYHMLLRDLQGKKVTQDVLKWVNSTNGL